jgi:hypothetical protein
VSCFQLAGSQSNADPEGRKSPRWRSLKRSPVLDDLRNLTRKRVILHGLADVKPLDITATPPPPTPSPVTAGVVLGSVDRWAHQFLSSIELAESQAGCNKDDPKRMQWIVSARLKEGDYLSRGQCAHFRVVVAWRRC